MLSIKPIESNIKGLEIAKWICDENITSNNIEPFPNKVGDTMLILGGKGSGKTSLILSLIGSKKHNVYYKKFNKVFLYMPKSTLSSLEDKHIIKKHIEKHPETTYSEITAQRIADLFRELYMDKKDALTEEEDEDGNKIKKELPKNLVILDDQGSFLKDKKAIVDEFDEDTERTNKVNTTNQKQLERLFSRARHLRMNLIFMCQEMKQAPKSLREQSSSLVIFKPSSFDRFVEIIEELCPISSKQAKRLINEVFDKPHNFLFVKTGANGKMFKFDITPKDDNEVEVNVSEISETYS